MKNITKIHILNCFNKLMETYPFEKITVEMILKESEISKSTFYRYYIDKYDVMNFSYVNFVEKLFKFNLCNSLQDIFVRILENAVENKKRIKNAYNYTGANSFTKFLHDYSVNRFCKFINETRDYPVTEEERIRLSILCYGYTWVTKDYINNKMNLTDKEIARQAVEALPETIKDLWYR